MAEEVERLVVITSFAGSGEGFHEVGVFKVVGLGNGGKSDGGVIEKRDSARNEGGAVGVGVGCE